MPSGQKFNFSCYFRVIQAETSFCFWLTSEVIPFVASQVVQKFVTTSSAWMRRHNKYQIHLTNDMATWNKTDLRSQFMKKWDESGLRSTSTVFMHGFISVPCRTLKTGQNKDKNGASSSEACERTGRHKLFVPPLSNGEK